MVKLCQWHPLFLVIFGVMAYNYKALSGCMVYERAVCIFELCHSEVVTSNIFSLLGC